MCVVSEYTDMCTTAGFLCFVIPLSNLFQKVEISNLVKTSTVIAGDAHPEAARQNGQTQRALPKLPESPHGPLGPT